MDFITQLIRVAKASIDMEKMAAFQIRFIDIQSSMKHGTTRTPTAMVTVMILVIAVAALSLRVYLETPFPSALSWVWEGRFWFERLLKRLWLGLGQLIVNRIRKYESGSNLDQIHDPSNGTIAIINIYQGKEIIIVINPIMIFLAKRFV